MKLKNRQYFSATNLNHLQNYALKRLLLRYVNYLLRYFTCWSAWFDLHFEFRRHQGLCIVTR